MTQLLDLGKLRFHFVGEWSNTTVYETNDVVKYGGNVYVYIYGLKTSGNLPTSTTYWSLMVEGFSFQGVYDNATAYNIGDGVAHGGKVYICIQDSTGNTPPNAAYWSQFADGIQWEGDYDNATVYQRNDVVVYGGSVYVALQDTTGNLPSNGSYWEKFVDGISPQGVYNAGTSYSLNDLVAYGGVIYRALGDTTGNLPSDATYWERLVDGISPRGIYNQSTTYVLNDIVSYGGNLYRAITETTGNLPTSQTYWELYQAGVSSKGEWATATAYEPNDVVSYGGNTFRCLLPHASATFAADLAANRWEKFNSGVRYRGVWSSSVSYVVDDIIQNEVNTYICLEDHTSGANFFDDLTAAKWQLFAKGGDYVLPAIAGNAGKYLSSDGNSYVWASGEKNWAEKTSAYTAVAGDRLFLNTAAGAFTITLPATAAVGDFVQFADASGTLFDSNVTIARNGHKIVGVDEDLILDKNNIGFKLVYSGATYGWRLS